MSKITISKRFVVAYNSPKYGVLMTQLETKNDYPQWEEIEKALEAEGEDHEAIQTILNSDDFATREIA